jgi:hypothetical protein
MAVLQKLKGIKFRKENIFKADIKKADVIYLFLLPKLLVKLKDKLQKESKKKCSYNFSWI